MLNKYIVNAEDIGIDYQDEGEWRSYRVYTEGLTIKECVDNAWIEECDQDGGTITDYPLINSMTDVYEAGKERIMYLAKVEGRFFEYLLQEQKDLCELFEQSTEEGNREYLRSQLKRNQTQIKEFLNDKS